MKAVDRCMNLFRRARRVSGRRGGDRVHIADPRFDDWEVVRDFEDVESAQAWRRHLDEAGIEAVITSDWEPDRFGHGDISLRVPPGSWSEAEEFLSNLDLD